MKRKKVLLTGCTGSGASYLAEFLIANTDFIIEGTTRTHNDIHHRNLRKIRDSIRLHYLDLMDYPTLSRFLDKNRYDIIYNIASIANVRLSFESPSHILNNNVNIMLNLLEVIRHLKDKDGYNPLIIQCSTSEIFGNPSPPHVPSDEQTPVLPINVYACSKLAQDNLCYIYYLNYGMNIVRTRMYSYLNARRGDLFATAFAKQILEVKQGKRKYIETGNLDSIRSIICADEAAEAYFHAIKCKVGEAYNIGGVEPISVGGVLNKLLEISGVKAEVRQVDHLKRPSDVREQRPIIQKFAHATGWRPRRTIDESIQHFWNEVLEFWGQPEPSIYT